MSYQNLLFWLQFSTKFSVLRDEKHLNKKTEQTSQEAVQEWRKQNGEMYDLLPFIILP